LTYLLAAYTILLVAVLGYLVIHALKVARLERELGELVALAEERRAEREETPVGR
jgi:CcmD family protein